MDLFTLCLRKKKCKYLIYNDNRFIHLPSEKKKCKYSIYNDNRFIHLPFKRKKL